MSLVKNENYVSNKKLSNLKLNKGQVMTTNSTKKYMNGEFIILIIIFLIISKIRKCLLRKMFCLI